MSVLVSSLLDSSLPLLARLKVACCIWRQGSLPAAERNALMLKWTCQELCLAYSRTNKTPPPHVTTSQLWRFLSSVLEAIVEGGEALQGTAPLNTYLFQVSHSVQVGVADCVYCREWVWSFQQQLPVSMTMMMM